MRVCLALVFCVLAVPAVLAESRWEELDAKALEQAQTGNPDAAIETGQAALEVARAEADDERTATSLTLLGEINIMTGNLDQAEELLLAGKAVWERVLPPLDYRHEETFNQLAKVAAARGRPEQAIAWYEQSLAKAEKAAVAGLEGPRAPRWTDLEMVLRFLSEQYHALGDTEKARQYHARAIEAMDRYVGDDLRQLHAALGQSFNTAMTRDDLDMAEALANRAIAATQEDGLQRAEALHLLAARVAKDRGNSAREAEIHREALAIAEAALPAEDHRLFGYLRRAALAESSLDHNDAAKSLWERALEVAEGAGDDIDPWTRAMSLESLAWIYEREDRYAEAEPLRRQAVHLHEGNPMVPSSILADARGELGRNLKAQENWQEAKELFSVLVAAAAPDEWIADRSYAIAADGLLEVALRVGDIQAATQAWIRFLAWRSGVLGEDAPRTHDARRDLAALERLGGKVVAAPLPESANTADYSEISIRVTTIFERDLREVLKRVMTSTVEPGVQGTHLELQGELLAAEDRPILAAEAYDKALSIRITTQGRSHEDTRRAAERLAELYQVAGRPNLAKDAIERVRPID